MSGRSALASWHEQHVQRSDSVRHGGGSSALGRHNLTCTCIWRKCGVVGVCGSVCVRFAACAHMDTRDHEPAHLNVTRCSLCILLLLLARDGDASSSPDSRRLRFLLNRLELRLRLPRRLISSCSSSATLISPVPRRQARTRSLACHRGRP